MSTDVDASNAASTTDGSDDGVNTVMTVVVTTQIVTMEVDPTDASSLAAQTGADTATTSAVPLIATTTQSTLASFTSNLPDPSTTPATLAAGQIMSTASMIASIASSVTTESSLLEQSTISRLPSVTTSILTDLPEVILPPASTFLGSPSALTQAASRVEVITSASPPSSTVSSSVSTVVAGTAVSSPTAIPSNTADAHKQAVVGGIAGAMGGSVFIAVLLLLCLCDRRKRKRPYRLPSPLPPPPVYDARPPMTQAQSSFAPIPYYATAKHNSIKSFRTADGNIIHVDVDQFSRPFAEQEGWRESVGPRRLQVMNPDRSLPETPNIPSDRMPGFFAGQYKTSPQSSTHEKFLHTTPPKLPMIHIDESPSEEYLTSARPSPAWSYKTPSTQVTPVVPQRSPQVVPLSTRSVQQPASPPMRTPAAIANLLHAFRSKSSQNVAEAQPETMRYSTTQYSPASSRRVSSITDPFELESPEVLQGARFIMQKPPRAVLPSDIKPFEGT